MLTSSQLQKLTKKLQVSQGVVLMEHYQLLILNQLSESRLGSNLVFKGGTCLRLAYGSFRFSEDLDFSLLNSISFSTFKTQLKKITRRLPQVEIDEVFKMKKTLFARLVVAERGLRIGIKLEISTRKEKLIKTQDYKLGLLTSPTSPIQPLIFSFTLEKIWTDKLLAIKNRTKPRDYFDLWYLSQVLKRPFEVKLKPERKLMMDRVRFLLPKNKRKILTEFEYEKS